MASVPDGGVAIVGFPISVGRATSSHDSLGPAESCGWTNDGTGSHTETEKGLLRAQTPPVVLPQVTGR